MPIINHHYFINPNMKFKVWKKCRKHFLRQTLFCLVLSTHNYWLTQVWCWPGRLPTYQIQCKGLLWAQQTPDDVMMLKYGRPSFLCMLLLFIYLFLRLNCLLQIREVNLWGKHFGSLSHKEQRESYLVIWGHRMKCTEKMSQENYYYNHIFIISVIVIKAY